MEEIPHSKGVNHIAHVVEQLKRVPTGLCQTCNKSLCYYVINTFTDTSVFRSDVRRKWGVGAVVTSEELADVLHAVYLRLLWFYLSSTFSSLFAGLVICDQ